MRMRTSFSKCAVGLFSVLLLSAAPALADSPQADLRTKRKASRPHLIYCTNAAPEPEGWQGGFLAAMQQFERGGTRKPRDSTTNPAISEH